MPLHLRYNFANGFADGYVYVEQAVIVSMLLWQIFVQIYFCLLTLSTLFEYLDLLIHILKVSDFGFDVCSTSSGGPIKVFHSIQHC